MVMSDIVRCVTGPQLYKQYRGVDQPGRHYSPNFLESKADSVLWCASALGTFCKYISPILIAYGYRRGWATTENSVRFAMVVIIFYGGTYVTRTIGRLLNPDYRVFLSVLDNANKNNSIAAMRHLRQFDFDMAAWPIGYRWQDAINGEKVKPRVFINQTVIRKPERWAVLEKVHDWLCYFAAHTFAGWLMYPGHLGLYRILLHQTLLEGRTKLVEQKGAQRNKLETKSGQSVDCVFVDRRNREQFPNGNVLVVVAEGNAGFYEIGCMSTVLDAGYSVLGWNHPGFGGSTGKPYPGQELEAVDVVMQYAVGRLGFDQPNVLLFAWSIGGFPATWAALNYHDVAGVVLDATFDDLLPLALPRMPSSWGSLVEKTVRNHWNHPISLQLELYQGPVLLIRRTKDEMICTDESSLVTQRATNRARDLLKKLLTYRYPNLMNAEGTDALLERWLDAYTEWEKMVLMTELKVDVEACVGQLLAAVTKQTDGGEDVFPLHIGPNLTPEEKHQLVVYLASRYMLDFDSVHCNPLPATLFRRPAHPWDSTDVPVAPVEQL